MAAAAGDREWAERLAINSELFQQWIDELMEGAEYLHDEPGESRPDSREASTEDAG
jgi:hypothetical protein